MNINNIHQGQHNNLLLEENLTKKYGYKSETIITVIPFNCYFDLDSI